VSLPRETKRTEDVVYATAVRLIAERGFHGTSLRDVAAAVPLQPASLYYYFDSKQAMLLSIMRRTMHAMHAFTEAAIAAAADDGATARLVAGVRAHVTFHGRNWRETLVTDSELRALEDGNRREIVSLRDRYQHMFVALLTEGTAEGVFRVEDVHLAATAIMTMCTGVAVWYRPSGRLSLEEIARQYSELVLWGLTPPASGSLGRAGSSPAGAVARRR